MEEAATISQEFLFSIESRIPSDILELIFEAGARISHWEGAAQPKPLEIVVSHVNQRWRQIAVNLASLWSSIFATPFEAVDKLETYLHRSKNHNLRVCLFACVGWWRRDMLEQMRPHLRRFRRFHLVTNFVHPSPTVSSHFEDFDMPHLNTFLFTPLDSGEYHGDSIASPFLPFTRPSPSLTSLRLNGPTMDLIRPPFATIVQLCLTEERFPFPFRSVCDILQSCNALVKLSFSGHTQRPHRRLATPLDVVPFVIPELKYLMLANGGNCDVLLSALSAPKLCGMRLCNFEEGDMAYFLQLSQVSKFPILESLSLVDDTFSVSDYHDIARVFPAIRSFACLNSSFTDDVLEFLVPLPTSDSALDMPWPNLASFSFSQAQFHEKHQALLCSLVSTRIALQAPLTHLFLGSANRLILDTERALWLEEELHLADGAELPEDEEMSLLMEFSGDGYRC
ncbi:F-box domain-containing protein [Mycena indigotica]|uniref:F-box domain-containing protein n=1 Tax=Mycena indigotica TaxID=2126181 RepID=A0A8H6WDL3_9AGAR|nr:F-box domain-containing protein [Mycena indigotica]KAF7312616.1 F-box domain-containing protein [Mycena indigotica]